MGLESAKLFVRRSERRYNGGVASLVDASVLATCIGIWRTLVRNERHSAFTQNRAKIVTLAR